YTDAAGVVPTNELLRHSINLRVTSKISKKFTLDSKVNYIRQDIDNQLSQGENFSNPIRHAYRLPRNIRTEDMAKFEYPDALGLMWQNHLAPKSNGGANPYWTINRNVKTHKEDRVVAFSSLKFEPFEGLSILGRAAIDRSIRANTEKLYNDSYIIAQFGKYT